jgi:hypothetical protein
MTKTRNHRRRHNTRNKSANSSTRIQKYKECCCEYTFYGLGQWHKAMFEKLGWMVLANKMGHIDKIHTYCHSIKRLKDAIDHKLKYHTHDHDRKEDLKIMYAHVCELEAHVNKDFT